MDPLEGEGEGDFEDKEAELGSASLSQTLSAVD